MYSKVMAQRVLGDAQKILPANRPQIGIMRTGGQLQPTMQDGAQGASNAEGVSVSSSPENHELSEAATPPPRRTVRFQKQRSTMFGGRGALPRGAAVMEKTARVVETKLTRATDAHLTEIRRQSEIRSRKSETYVPQEVRQSVRVVRPSVRFGEAEDFNLLEEITYGKEITHRRSSTGSTGKDHNNANVNNNTNNKVNANADHDSHNTDPSDNAIDNNDKHSNHTNNTNNTANTVDTVDLIRQMSIQKVQSDLDLDPFDKLNSMQKTAAGALHQRSLRKSEISGSGKKYSLFSPPPKLPLPDSSDEELQNVEKSPTNGNRSLGKSPTNQSVEKSPTNQSLLSLSHWKSSEHTKEETNTSKESSPESQKKSSRKWKFPKFNRRAKENKTHKVAHMEFKRPEGHSYMNFMSHEQHQSLAKWRLRQLRNNVRRRAKRVKESPISELFGFVKKKVKQVRQKRRGKGSGKGNGSGGTTEFLPESTLIAFRERVAEREKRDRFLRLSDPSSAGFDMSTKSDVFDEDGQRVHKIGNDEDNDGCGGVI
jgi:hypothetical protein